MATVTSSKRHLVLTSDTYTSNGDVVVGGDLTIQGTTTTLDTANLLVEDKNIIIGNVSSPSDTTADGGGITLKGASDKTISWSNANNRWDFNQGITSSGDITAANLSGTNTGNNSANTHSSLFIDRGSIDVTTSSGGSNSNPFDDAHTETKVAENGMRTISYTGASAFLYTFNNGGSASVVQIGAHYNGEDYYLRTRTDSSNWQTWKKIRTFGNTTIPTVPDSYAPTDAEANVQADWTETTTTSDAFILNKPTIPTDHDGLYLPIGGGALTGDVTSNSLITADLLRLTNDATDTTRHRISVYDSGSTSYGMMLWNSNGTSGDWATMIYGPNQSNRRISFGKANANFATNNNHAGVDELAWLDLDNGNYFTDGNIYPGGSTTKYVSTGRIDNWNTAYTHSQAAHAPTDAEANVQSDWNATSGDALILNKPTIPPDYGAHNGVYLKTNYRANWIRVGYGNSGGVRYHKLATIVVPSSYVDYNATFDWTGRYASGTAGIHLHSDANTTAVVYGAWYEDFNPTKTLEGTNGWIKYTKSGDTVEIWIKTSGWREFDYIQKDSVTEGSPTVTWYNENTTTDQSTEPSNLNAFTNRTHTAAGYSTATGVADNAEVNVQADWTATSGDALILNKPTIPTVPDSYAPTDAEANVQADWTATSGDALILNKPTIPTDHGDHDGLYLPIGGGTVTGDLTVNGKVTQAGSVGREEWGRVYSASITTIATLITSDGSALPTGGAYRMTAHIPGTGTDQVSMAVFWNENGTWYCNNTFAGGTSSNHIEFLISGSVPKIKTWHSNNYNIQVTHERLFLGETGTDNLRGYFGADSFLKWLESTNTLTVPGTISASGYNDTNWNTAYTHSQATHAPTDAEANVQADWTETTTTSDAYILNKPATFAPSAHDHDSTYVKLTSSEEQEISGDVLFNDTVQFDGDVQNITSTTAVNIQTTGGAMLVLKDTNSAGVAANPYINFVDSSNTRVGYIGIGSTGNSKLYLEGLGGIQTNNPLSVTGSLTVSTTGNFAGKVNFQGDAAIEGGSGYGVFKGYTGNDNHFISVRGIVANTSTTTITGGHQTTFVEHADESNEGWYFKSKTTGTYREIARIDGTNKMYLGGNEVWNAGNDGSGSGLDADTVDGSHANLSYGAGKQYDFTVNGNADVFYPVVISGMSSPRMTRLTVYRSYSETAPSTWNTSTHKGGLTLDMDVRVGGWGGYPNMINVHDFGEIYSRICGGAAYTAHTMKFVIWLRGGTASYHIDSPNKNLSIEVNDNTSASNYVTGSTGNGSWYSYTNSNTSYNVTVSAKDLSDADIGAKDLLVYMPIRYNGSQNKVISGVSLPTSLDANNANTLDNLDSTEFLRSNTADTASSKISFTASESIGFKGARGGFTNEYIHLYNKVGIGHPSGWGQGEADTPATGLSTYGGASLSYGTKAESTVHGNLNVGSAADTGNRDLYLHGSTANKKSRLRTTNGNLHIDSADGNSLYLNYYYGAGTNIYFGTGNGGYCGTVSSAGILRMASDVVAYYSFSDRRLKTNIKTTENNLDKILSLNPVEYTWKEGPREGVKEIGLIAQEVEEVVPEVVRVQSRHHDEKEEGEEYKQVDYEHLVSTLIGAMQEQQKQIDELKSQISVFNVKKCKCKK